MAIPKQTKIVHPGGFDGGVVRVPGDKSISHRTALLAGISSGTSEIRGFLQAEDCLNTLKAMESFGARSWVDEDGVLSIQGTGGKIIEPVGPLDVGNSGTGMRLLAGLCSGSPITVTLTGDESLQSRPMRRIKEPLELMGAKVELTPQGTAPMTIHGGKLHGIEYSPADGVGAGEELLHPRRPLCRRQHDGSRADPDAGPHRAHAARRGRADPRGRPAHFHRRLRAEGAEVPGAPLHRSRRFLLGGLLAGGGRGDSRRDRARGRRGPEPAPDGPAGRAAPHGRARGDRAHLGARPIRKSMAT